VEDIVKRGCEYTWNNKQEGSNRVYSKLDRVLVNEDWQLTFPTSFGHFMPEMWFDHTPVVIQFVDMQWTQRKPFKFLDYWSDHEDFLKVVEAEWKRPVTGVKMYNIVRKLQNLKSCLRQLNRAKHGSVELDYIASKKELEGIQQQIHKNVHDQLLRDKESQILAEFKRAQKVFFSFLRQRAKIDWLQMGDENSSFFYRSIKRRAFRKRI
jgi:hypothetical protein